MTKIIFKCGSKEFFLSVTARKGNQFLQILIETVRKVLRNRFERFGLISICREKTFGI